MTIDLYYEIESPPSIAVILAAKAIGVELNLILMDLETKQEHLTPEFLKINPQHTVPTLVDNGHVVWESRAIIIYLADKYGQNDSLYPKDPAKRSVIHQRVFFDLGVFYQRFADYFYPLVFEGKPANLEALQKIATAFEFLELFLEGNTWLAGEDLTVADIVLFATLASYAVAEYEFSGYKNVTRWYEQSKTTLVGYSEVVANFEKLKTHFVPFLVKNSRNE